MANIEYLVVALAERLRRRFATALAPLDLTASQFSALAVLDRSPGITAAELARAILLRPQSVGPLLDRLEHRGLVSRGSRRGRGMAAPVTLTAAGHASLEAGAAIAQRLEAETREVLGPARHRALAEAAREVLAHLDGTGSSPGR